MLVCQPPVIYPDATANSFSLNPQLCLLDLQLTVAHFLPDIICPLFVFFIMITIFCAVLFPGLIAVCIMKITALRLDAEIMVSWVLQSFLGYLSDQMSRAATEALLVISLTFKVWGIFNYLSYVVTVGHLS